jgi:hypothetical protein
VEKTRVASGAEARAPTRGSDEEGRLVCSTVNGGSGKQSGGHRWERIRSGQQPEHDLGSGRGPGHSPQSGALIGNEALVVVNRRDTQQLVHSTLAPRA